MSSISRRSKLSQYFTGISLKDFKHRVDAEASQAVRNRIVVSKVMNRCQKCKNELVAEARFCNICGAPQNPENAQSVPPVPPEKSPGPDRTIQLSSKRTYSPHVSGDTPNRPAKTARPPALPKRRNASGVIVPVTLPQRDTPQELHLRCNPLRRTIHPTWPFRLRILSLKHALLSRMPRHKTSTRSPTYQRNTPKALASKDASRRQ